jgi:hypothetical protein
MMRLRKMMARWRLLLATTTTLMVLGCATLPPAQPARDLKAIVGRWEGTLRLRDGAAYGAKLVITEDGRFETVVDRPIGNLGTSFPGTVKVENGRFRYVSEKTGAVGTMTLHEGEGKRVLTSSNDNGVSTAQYVPAKP